MNNPRLVKEKLNIIFSLLNQAITLICGLVIPGIMLGAFGSEVYGATASIGQFLAYITLLEGGIGGVARSVLYKPLADNDMDKVSAIVSEIRRFFKIIAFVFLGYVLILSVGYKFISGFEALDWITTAVLVVVISISTFGQYFIGISNSVLLQAHHKTYITHIVNSVATVLNAVLVILLALSGCDIIIVKLVSSIVFFLRPVILDIIVRKTYQLKKIVTKEVYLNQKATALGQHLAYFLHSNTDIAILTLFSNLLLVSIYSVYNMVVASIQNFASSFSTGMEALFGDMYARDEQEELNNTFNRYETMISIVSIILFSTTAVLIVPFISIYTRNITDADYIQPLFAILLTISALVYCLRMPYHSMTIAAGKFKETKWAAYGEAIINVGLSIILVFNFGLVGVAIGTLVATTFRFIFYVFYLSKNLIFRSVWMFIKRQLANAVAFIAIYLVSAFVISFFDISNYGVWVICGFITVVIAAIITLSVNMIFYRKESLYAIKKIFAKIKK